MRLPITVLVVFSACAVAVTGFWDWVASNVLPGTTWGLYSRSFFENVLVEAHGTILDLFVVGVVLYWLDKRRGEKDEIHRHREALADLRFYRAPDSSFRALGTVKRLLTLGVEELHLSELTFSNLDITGLRLVGCNVHATVFTDSRLQRVTIENCDCDAAIFAGATFEHVSLKNSCFRRARFQGASLKGIDFETCRVEVADFTNANLRSANFRGVDCRGVNFRGADLRSANFIGAKNLTPQMLQVAHSIKYLKTNDSALQALVAAAKK